VDVSIRLSIQFLISDKRKAVAFAPSLIRFGNWSLRSRRYNVARERPTIWQTSGIRTKRSWVSGCIREHHVVSGLVVLSNIQKKTAIDIGQAGETPLQLAKTVEKAANSVRLTR
jgi:hypothetical protein